MTTSDHISNGKLVQTQRLRWVPINQTKVNPLAQRELNEAWALKIADEFNPDLVGTPVVSYRDDAYWVIDGQHRIEALRHAGYGDISIQCWVYEGLTSEQEADLFLSSNDTKLIQAMPRYRTAVHAGREVESDIDRVVRAQGLVVSTDRIPGAVRAVGTLRRVYDRAGAATLGRSLRIIRDAYGDAGFEALVIDGVALMCQRYNGHIDDAEAVEKLRKSNGGVNGLLNQADVLRRQTGHPKAHCVAAAAVDVLNRGKRGRGALPSWWKS